MQTKAKELLEQKGTNIISVKPHHTVYEVIKTLVEHNIGAVLVMDEDGQLKGIFTERDVLKEILRRSDRLKTTEIKDVMTTDLIIGLPDDDVEYLMGIMTTNKIRHIPILENHEVKGILSIGDLVKTQLHDARYENRYLRDYIMGKYPV